MKRIALLLIGILIGAGSAQAEQYWSPDPRPPRICVQNFNAYGPIYASHILERTERIAGFLQAIPKCEVVHLQEVWNESQIDVVEKYLHRQYNISAPNRKEKIGVMSLIMGDILATETQSYRVNNEGGVLDSVRKTFNVKKAFHVVRARFFDIDEEFYFMNTHLHPTSVAVRLTQILDLLHWRLGHQDAKYILSGDFNADLPSLERKAIMALLGVHDSMEEFLGGSYPQGYCTYCAGNPLGWMLSDHTFDYIFFSNVGTSSSSLKPVEGQVNMRGTPRAPWSDHFGVRVELSVEPSITNISASALKEKRRVALSLLSEVIVQLRLQKEPEFKPYADYAQDLQLQLLNRKGAFNSYFESYR